MRLIFIPALLLAVNVASSQTGTVTIVNPTATERKDQLIIFKRAFLEKKIGFIAREKFVTAAIDHQPQVVQYDDLDADGIWDEAILLSSFKPNESKRLKFSVENAPSPVKAVVRAHVRHRHKLPGDSFGPSVLTDTMPLNNPPTDFSKQKLPPYLTEGPAWENDKVGFRKYFDTRNTNDIWGKVTTRMVLDEVGVNPAVIYHHYDSSWGMDILKVGKSLGAGAIALQLTLTDGRDTLVRPGANALITYKQLADGPLRAMFRITYQNWKIMENMAPVTITETISIWGGQYFFENTVQVKGAPANAKLITGFASFYENVFRSYCRENTHVLFSFGQQSENQDNLGMAVLAKAKPVSGVGSAPHSNSDVSDSYLVAHPLDKDTSFTYRFVSAWSRSDGRFNTMGGFESVLDQISDELQKPVIVR